MPLLGNMRTLHTLKLMIQNNRLPHAIILEGPAGSGKKTLALYLAKAFMCAADTPPCNCCNCCKTLSAGSHPDYTFFQAEKDYIGVDDMRKIRSEAYYQPISAKCRVFVINAADTMNEQAQNALLKVIEEPPAASRFIFLCESAAALLVTIRSRCVSFTLGGVEVNQEAIDLVAKKTGAAPALAKSALIQASGVIGQALVYLSQQQENTVTADELLALVCEHRNDYELLVKMQPLAKQREMLKVLLRDLKFSIAAQMKNYALGNSCPFSGARLAQILQDLTTLEESLVMNPPMGLVLCSICDLLTH